jgi:4-amino-4-deoxy-L-arabinose transferase-like glycosyltransferase
VNKKLNSRLQNISPLSATLLLILASAVLSFLVAGQVEFSSDEAHYALYGAYLDWSYFDHPPMVGWLNALILPFSHSEFALRALPILMFAGASMVVYQLARECFPEANPWLGFVSVAILQSGILFHIIALAMIPDTPLLLFGLLAMLMLWRALRGTLFRFGGFIQIHCHHPCDNSHPFCAFFPSLAGHSHTGAMACTANFNDSGHAGFILERHT